MTAVSGSDQWRTTEPATIPTGTLLPPNRAFHRSTEQHSRKAHGTVNESLTRIVKDSQRNFVRRPRSPSRAAKTTDRVRIYFKNLWKDERMTIIPDGLTETNTRSGHSQACSTGLSSSIEQTRRHPRSHPPQTGFLPQQERPLPGLSG